MTTFGFGEGTGLQSVLVDGFLNMPSSDLSAQIVNFGLSEENEEVVQESRPISHAMMTGQMSNSPMLGSSVGAHKVNAHPYPRNTVSRSLANITEPQPYTQITEEPRQRGLRFRYQCEGRSAGSIPGQNSTAEKKTFPTIKIQNHRGPAIIVVSCVTKDAPHKPHPHALVGKDCKKGVCTVKVKDTTVINFPHLGIQCAKKKGIIESLELRKKINVDPFQTGFEFNNTTAEMSAVRLCFQVFLPDTNGKINKVLPPVVSQAIHDKKALNDLVICRVDRSSGKAQGGDEVFLLCEKINKDDIGVRFYEEGGDGSIVWESYGTFGAGDVHRQYAIVFKTPPYRESFISRPVDISMQLQRPSDGDTSEAINFTYMPEDPDPDRIEEKRKRKAERMVNLENDISAGPRFTGANINVKEGLRCKLKASRKMQATEIKTEAHLPVQGIPQYNLGNIGTRLPDGSANTFNFRTSDNTSMGNMTIAQNPSSSASAMPVPIVTMDPNPMYNPDRDLLDASNFDPQVLIEYIQDNCIEGRDILSFDSIDMVAMGNMESDVSGFQQVGANEFVNTDVADSQMESDTFSNAQEALNRLQK